MLGTEHVKVTKMTKSLFSVELMFKQRRIDSDQISTYKSDICC